MVSNRRIRYRLNWRRVLALILILSVIPILLYSLNHPQQQPESKQSESVSVPTNSWFEPGKTPEFKSWMDYGTITNETSEQYELQHFARTGAHGIRIYNEAYMIAVGSGWGLSVGDYCIVTFDGRSPIACVVGDLKSDIHTDPERHVVDLINGSIIEFIVQDTQIPESVAISGSFNSIEVFNYAVTNIYQEEMPYD